MIWPWHKHSVARVIFCDHVAVEGGGHTAFRLLVCHCGRVIVFPEENFNLITPYEKGQFDLMLKHSGLWRDDRAV